GQYTHHDTTPLAQLHFLLLPNLGAERNPELSNLANAQGFLTDWEPSRTDVAGVYDAQGSPLAWHYEAAPAVQQLYSLERGILVVDLPTSLMPSTSIEVVIDFVTSVPHRRGDEGRFNGDITWRFGWFPVPRYRDETGWSDKAVLTSFTHHTRVAAPTGYRVLIGADRSEQAGTVTVARSPVAVRSIPLVASRRLQCLARTIDGIAVSLCYYRDAALLDTSEGEAREKLTQLERIVRHHQARYGPYRLSSLVGTESPTTYLSMAADGLVLLGDLFFLHDRTWIAWGIYRPIGEVVLAHELGHEWWGVGRAVDFDTDNWISEGLAELAAREYAQERFGERGEDSLHANFFVRWVLANLAGTALPKNSLYETVLPSYRDHVRFGVDDLLSAPRRDIGHREEEQYLLYEKGYLAVRAMNALLGPAATGDLWRVLAHEDLSRPLTPEALRRAALLVANRDIGPYLRAFVYGDASSDLAIESVHSESRTDGVHTRVRVLRRGALGLPATVAIRTPEGTYTRRWDASADVAELDFVSPRAPDEVSIDAEAYVPDSDRANNFWPRRQRFGLLAPQGDADTTTLALNPMPVHREYLAGVSLGGRRGSDYAWWLGGGLAALGQHVDSAEKTLANWYEYAGYASWSLPLRRGLSTGLAARTLRRQDPLAGNLQQEELALGATWSLYEVTPLGYPGTFELPRTTLDLELRGGHAAVEGVRNWWMTPTLDGGRYVFEGPRGTLGLTLTRNELLRYGLLVQGRGFAGVHPWTRAALQNIEPTVLPNAVQPTFWQPWSSDTLVPLFYR
ncbi:MAG: hypothetical protein AAB426_11300, partial [Myxococcota bacterium]